MPYRQCKKPGCVELVPAYGGNGYCQKHAKEDEQRARERKRLYDANRGTAAQRGYGAKWQRAREVYLSKNPLCAHCRKENKIIAAIVVDHIVPHRGDMKLFWDQSNWQPLCDYHHNLKTAKGE
ncbi:MAG: HNH endonuclease [Deltaproteobacteria bacterium]|nr:HNH endonuclease [Deltaproteobacteria bacterium]